MERAINGTKLGGNKIIANLTRFAKENVGIFFGGKEGSKTQPKQPQSIPIHNQSFFNKGKGKLFSDLFHNEAHDPVSKYNRGEEPRKTIEIVDETQAFKDLIGLALVGRCKDLVILRNLNVLIMEKKIIGVSLSYLGGLYMLVKFEDEDSCDNFMLDHNCWKEWFSSLDPWNCQSLPFERLAWVKVQGVPMHLADNDVLNNIAEKFGKVVHGSFMEAEDGNLSVSWIGLLVGEGNRIHDHVTLRWKNKQYRVWIEEEINDWVPDSIGKVVVSHIVSSSSGASWRDLQGNEENYGVGDRNNLRVQAMNRPGIQSVTEVDERNVEVNAVDVDDPNNNNNNNNDNNNNNNNNNNNIFLDTEVGDEVGYLANHNTINDDRRNDVGLNEDEGAGSKLIKV
ncbi:hypothetical protein HanHA89_Chr06g0243781 [Helianthus annuus]|nr:hypothetical protein HanHA89_Chr06g0243781 [Helianthus annuus]